MVTLRFAMSGADFGALFQLATWKELAAVESVAIFPARFMFMRSLFRGDKDDEAGTRD